VNAEPVIYHLYNASGEALVDAQTVADVVPVTQDEAYEVRVLPEMKPA
jgi:hypothetical protein